MHIELYLGYRRGFIGNPKGFARDAAVFYEDDRKPYTKNVPYLHGAWNVSADYVESADTSEGSYLLISFEGFRASPDVESISREGEVRISMDEQAKDPVVIHGRELLTLIDEREYVSRVLKLEPVRGGIRIYRVTAIGARAS